jgi:superfamily II DNA or RNA helicase
MTTATAICALRPYQADDLEQIKAALIKYRRVVYALATGGGKTSSSSAARRPSGCTVI